LVAKEEVFLEVHGVVELKNIRCCRGYVEFDYLVVAHAAEFLNDAAETIAVGHNEDFVVGLESLEDGAFVVGHESGDGVFEGFGERNLGIREFGVAGIHAGATLFVHAECRGLHVETATPEEDLLVAILSGGVGLVETLDCTITLLVKTPTFFYGQIVHIHGIENLVEGFDGAFEIGGKADFGAVTFLLEQFASLECFFYAVLCEVDIRPTGE
jgi:hypothetical protein